MNYFNLAKAWVQARIGERTSWDGGVIIAVSIVALVATLYNGEMRYGF